MDCHVTRAIGNARAGSGKAFVIGIGHARHRVGVFRTWEGKNHVEVNAKETIAIGLAQSASHDRSPIATLGDVTVVTKLLHHFSNRISNAIHMEFGLNGWARKSITGHGRHYNVKRIGGTAAIGLGIGEWTDDIEKFHKRTWPTVGQHHRRGIGMLRSSMDEVHLFAGGSGHEVRPRIHTGFAGTPVVLVSPVIDGRLHFGHGNTKRPRFAGCLVGPTHVVETTVQVLEDFIWNGDGEWLRRHGQTLRQPAKVTVTRLVSRPSTTADTVVVCSASMPPNVTVAPGKIDRFMARSIATMRAVGR
ncbi:unannotated protein [freshwater metagenome]|uniref:Unannotated protein n=1 Tax=freshwater metagenome TaxID=449393 RepID=A0A6J7LHV3_9ZZZZ